jgi:CRP-like cAMP-binding protein
MIIILAMSRNRVIGSGKGMPWSVPDEYRQFLDFVRGQSVIMGRRSFEIFGSDLGETSNFVISRTTKEIPLTMMKEKDFFGEVPLFERLGTAGVMRVTTRALGDVRVLTVDKKTILRRIHEDPSLAYRILETMARRIRELEEDMVRLLTDEDPPPES